MTHATVLPRRGLPISRMYGSRNLLLGVLVPAAVSTSPHAGPAAKSSPPSCAQTAFVTVHRAADLSSNDVFLDRTPAASVQNVTLSPQRGDRADFNELLGKKAVTELDGVFDAASFEIDQSGGEGGAATAAVDVAVAVAVAKSFAVPTTQCAIDMPFDFALMHRMTGTPLFEGRVTDPTIP